MMIRKLRTVLANTRKHEFQNFNIIPLLTSSVYVTAYKGPPSLTLSNRLPKLKFQTNFMNTRAYDQL